MYFFFRNQLQPGIDVPQNRDHWLFFFLSSPPTSGRYDSSPDKSSCTLWQHMIPSCVPRQSNTLKFKSFQVQTHHFTSALKWIIPLAVEGYDNTGVGYCTQMKSKSSKTQEKRQEMSSPSCERSSFERAVSNWHVNVGISWNLAAPWWNVRTCRSFLHGKFVRILGAGDDFSSKVPWTEWWFSVQEDTL